MKHSIRQRVLDPVTGLKVTKIETANGELGTGVFDKHGREIFEGDLIKNPAYNPEDVMDSPNYVVFYDPEESAFVYRDPVLHENSGDPFRNDPLGCFPDELEIVGHAED